MIITIVCICVVIRQMPDLGGTAAVVGMLASMVMSWSLLVGPQILRQDFRQDLLLADVLKTYPVPPWQIALGELLAPVVILTAFHWLLLLIAAILLSNVHSVGVSSGLVISIAAGAAVVMPALNLIIFQVPNAAALLFPGWFMTSRGGPGGIEAMGSGSSSSSVSFWFSS